MTQILKQETHWQDPFQITTITLGVSHWPEVLNGFTLVQLSDLHVDHWNQKPVKTAVKWVNEVLKPDLIVLTGDYIACSDLYLRKLTELLTPLSARYGVYACLGNHDYEDWHWSKGARTALKEANIQLLINEHVKIGPSDEAWFYLGGADDLMWGDYQLKKTFEGREANHPFILLNHNPSNFPEVATHQPDLILSGHTHGGQVWMPLPLRQWYCESDYTEGAYWTGETLQYVSRGVGNSVFVKDINRLVKHNVLKGEPPSWVKYLPLPRIMAPTPRWLVPREIPVFKFQNI